MSKEKRLIEAREANKSQFDSVKCQLNDVTRIANEYGSRIVEMETKLSRIQECAPSWFAQAKTAIDSGLANLGILNYQVAIIHFNYAIAASQGMDSTVAMAYFCRGICYRGLDNTVQALRDWDSTVIYDENNASAWNNRAAALAELGDYELSIESANRALSIDPQSGTAWANKVLAFNALNVDDSIIACATRAIEFGVDDIGVRSSVAVALKRSGRFADAVFNYNVGIGFDSTSPEIWYNKGLALRAWADSVRAINQENHAMELYREAISSFNRAISSRADYFKPYYDRAMCEALMGEFCDAASSADSCIKYAPMEWEFFMNICYARIGFSKQCTLMN